MVNQPTSTDIHEKLINLDDSKTGGKAQTKQKETGIIFADPTVTKTSDYDPIKYDTELIDDFLATVFGTDSGDDEHILGWSITPGMSPGYPKDGDELLNQLKNVETAFALYFSTATVTTHLGDNTLYNRKALFNKFYVLVLDDIGTKVAIDKLPEELIPTYIIESSKDNYQYGYVLEQPITDLEHAEALVQLAYSSGFSDEGGKMANKLVRIPEGVNGKAGEKGKFRVQLKKIDGPLWTPEKLIEAMRIPYSWDDIKKDVNVALKNNTFDRVNASIWSGTKPLYASATGAIDPVLEWLHENDMIVTESSDWFVIHCPWAHLHTKPDDTAAGYNPVGYGSKPDCRAFNCFHAHGVEHKTNDFLAFVANLGGPEVAVNDFAAPLLAQHVFDDVANGAWEILPQGGVLFRRLDSFRSKYISSRMRVVTMGGKIKDVTAASMWLSSPLRVDVAGSTVDPGSKDRIVYDSDNLKYVNMFRPPNHVKAPIDMAHVDRFNEYIEYLIPDKEERDYFNQWLWAKVQNQAFRGAAIVMYTHGTQGIGRTTLGHMIRDLINRANFATEDFETVVGGGAFNDWMACPFVMVNEARSHSEGSFYTNYERLKELIDPSPEYVTINPKYAPTYKITLALSFMFLSNHPGGLRFPKEDRRFHVIANTDNRRPPAFYAAHNEWLDEGSWAAHVYNWIMQQEPDLKMLHAPPPMTAGKREMMENSRTSADVIMEVLEEELRGCFLNTQAKEIVEKVVYARGLPEETTAQVIKHKVNPASITVKNSFRVEGKPTKPRAFVTAMSGGEAPDMKSQFDEAAKNIAREQVASIDIPKIITDICDRLDILGL